MDGLILLQHHHQGSYDSTDSGSLPPTYSRLPPDGHEFPEDYVDPSLSNSLADNQLDFLSRKSSASSTASLDRHELRSQNTGRTRPGGAEDKLSGVRAKIALFSSETSRTISGTGKVSVGSSLTRAHTHSDVRFDDKRQSLKTETRKVKGNSAATNLKAQNKSTSFRSMINVSSSPGSESFPAEQNILSRTDMTKSTDALLRSHKKDQIIWEEAVGTNEKTVKTVPTISTRSQSLNEIGKVRQAKVGLGQHKDIGVLGKSRSTTTIVPGTGGPEQPSARKSSMTNLIEQRRRSTMTKLKGLVIPEILTENNSPNHNSSKEKTLAAGKPSSSGSFSNKISGSALPNPPWKDKNTSEDFPKYSPAFKRKPFTVYSNGSGSLKKEEADQTTRAKPPIGKKNSDESSGGVRLEDSDNDSAVSSGRSSLSCRSCTPPTSPKTGHRERSGSSRNSSEAREVNPRVLKKNSVEAINRQNVLNACKKSSANSKAGSESSEPPAETLSSPRNNKACSRPASRSSSFTIAERKKSLETQSESRRGSNSSHDSVSVSRKNSRDFPDKSSSKMEEFSSVRSSRVTTPTGNCHYPESIMDIEERVAFMTEVVDRAASVTPTERRSLSRTPSIASERSSYSSRSSRNSSIVSEKAPFARNSSIMSKDSAISEDISKEMEEKPGGDKRWSDLEKKYSRGLSSSSIGETISKLAKSTEDSKTERPKDLLISPKKITAGINSPSSKNFKELAEKWQTMSGPESVTAGSAVSTLPRKSSREKAREETGRTGDQLATLPRRASREKSPLETPTDCGPAWCSPPALGCTSSFYQVSGDTQWSGFDIREGGKGELPDRKYSVPAFNESAVKLREKKDNVPSRPSSLIESSDQKDLKIFEIGNLGDNNRLMLGSASTSQSSSQADLLDSHSVTSDTPKSPLPSSSSREILDVFSNRNNRRAVSVNDIRRAFEKAEQSLSTSGTSGPKRSGLSTPSSHNRMSSLDSTTSSEESSIPTPHFHGSVTSLASGHGGDRLKDHYGSITSLASSTSVISPQELQNLIDEANQSLEESGTPSHEIMVIVLHREFSGGTIGITLAGGADYESKEITVHKVIAGSLADRDGRIQKGDRVLSINGRSTKGITHREALSILKAPRAEVVLVLSRSRSVTPADRSYDLIDASTYNFINSSRPPKILESPLDSKSLSADLKFVDVPRGPPITVTLKKEGAGLGFSLEGGKDSPYGDRPMTIKKIFTGGAADKNGILKVGDEILFVNNVDITRMTRLEAWNFMKKLNDGSQVVVVRQKLDPSAKTGHSHREIPVVKTELVGDTNPLEKTH